MRWVGWSARAVGFLVCDTYSFMCGSVLRGAAKTHVNAVAAITCSYAISIPVNL